ncbi:hypothetical protein J6590_029547 [Homalodisca vitripennis]|nr:hypothetical protein J6590_029547 [Homalodisca vitripennis]
MALLCILGNNNTASISNFSCRYKVLLEERQDNGGRSLQEFRYDNCSLHMQPMRLKILKIDFGTFFGTLSERHVTILKQNSIMRGDNAVTMYCSGYYLLS